MKKTKLIQILETLSDEEMKHLGSFIRCGMFNSRSVKVVELLDAIAEYYPGFEDEDFTKENLWGLIYPEKKYNDVVMRNLISDLYGLVKKFLIHLNLSRDPYEANKALCHELFSRGLPEMTLKEVEKAEKFIHDNYREADGKYYDLYILDCISTYIRSRDLQYQDYSHAQDKIMLLVHYFIKEMMAYYKNYTTLKTYINSEYDMMLFDELMTFTDMNYNKLESSVQLIFNTTVILIYPHREDVFEKTLELVKEKGIESDRMSHFNILISLENYCINKYNAGNYEYLYKLREIHLEQAKHGLLGAAHADGIQESTFTNVVKTALRCKEYDWVDKFIRDNIHQIKENQDDMLNYYMAYLNHSKGENEKALEYLSKMKVQDLMEKINMNNLQMKIYFDLGYYDNVLMAAENYKKYFSGNAKISEVRKSGNKNFIAYTLKVLRAIEKNDNDALGVLEKKIRETKPVTSKDWLLSKITEKLK